MEEFDGPAYWQRAKGLRPVSKEAAGGQDWEVSLPTGRGLQLSGTTISKSLFHGDMIKTRGLITHTRSLVQTLIAPI